MKASIRLVLLFLLVQVIFACDSKRVYEQNNPIPERIWKVGNKISFDFEILDTLSSYNMYFNLRNDNSYPFANLYVYSWFKKPDGVIKKDTLQFILAKPDGTWIGNSSGDLINNQIMFARKVDFKQPGKYVFEFEQGMRSADLIGVSDIGLRVETAD